MVRMWAEIFNFVKNTSLRVIEFLCRWINSATNKPPPPPTPPPPPPPPGEQPPPSTTVELSGGMAAAVPEQAPPPAAPNLIGHHNRKMREWPFLVIGVCSAAAALGLQATQTFETLSLSFHFFCLALQFSYTALILSIYLRTGYPLASVVMEHVSIFFGSTAFTVVIAMNLLTSFMLISVAVYLISILLIIFINLFGHTV